MPTNFELANAAQKPESVATVTDPAVQLLARAQAHRDVIQQFAALADSLEWNLGQEYLRSRGTKAFTADSAPIPFWVNNDGGLSRNAAEVFYEGLEARGEGRDKREIYVLELGIGVGLFARYFLDEFRALCRQRGADYYERLCYIAADRSPRMLMDVARNGILAGHAGHFRLRVVDALKVDEALPFDVCFKSVVSSPSSVVEEAAEPPRRTDCLSVHDGQADGLTIRPTGKRRFQAVFLNYLLDCLPAMVLDVQGDDVKQLCVRTCVARNVNLAEHTDMSLAALQERAKIVASGEGSVASARARQELLEVYGLFASEYEYRPVAAGEVPYGDFVLPFARECGKRVLHNYGAIQCLDKILDLLEPGGFILMNEYGMTKMSEEDDFEHQRFSQTTAVGLNFPLLKAYFEQKGQQADVGRIVYPSATGGEAGRIDNPSYGGDGPALASHPSSLVSRPSPLASRPSSLIWIEADGDEKRGIHTRLLGLDIGAERVARFHERFKLATFEWAETPVNKARECVKAGRFEVAASLYREALRRQPRNWVLLNEISGFMTYSLRDPKSGADMAKLAIKLNPACSSDLWCTLGDALFEWGRTAEAKSAYLRALAINPSDVRGRFNLAFVHTREGGHHAERDGYGYRAALVAIADALALDNTGQWRDRLLAKQAEVLQLLAVKNQAEYLRMVNLVSKPEANRQGAADGKKG